MRLGWLHNLLLLTAILWIGGAFSPLAAGLEDREDFDRRILAELEALDPDAARLFSEANDLYEGGAYDKAAAAYRRVGERQPDFDHAIRREGWSLLALGRREEAVELGRQAYFLSISNENRLLLVAALASTGERTVPTETELLEARGYARRMLEDPELDVEVLPILCDAAARAEDSALLKRCLQRMGEDHPDQRSLAVFTWALAMMEGRRDDARLALEKARSAGVPAEAYASMEKATNGPRSRWPGILRIVGLVALVWGVGLLLLLGAGLGLSRMAMRAAQRIPTVASGEAVGLDRALRRLYSAVLWLSCGYYYVSLPLILLMILGIGGSVVYTFFFLGHVPIKLLALVLIAVIVSVWATVSSLFIRSPDEDPGERLDLEAHPELRRVLEEVAARIETRPVDNVYLTPGTAVAVLERGGFLRRVRGATERCLILGLGVLEGMTLSSFKAVLAHEYGHFSNRDTSGGGMSLATRRSMLKMGVNLAQGGVAAWYNPAWLFFNGFYRIFLRISQGSSRLQEVLADRYAAFAYGAGAFERGLRHVIERGIRFEARADATLDEVIENEAPLANLYTHAPSQMPDPQEIDTAVQAALSAEPSPYDSHPSPRDRFEWVRRIGDSDAPAVDSDEVWSLFPDREALERRMTDLIRRNVAVVRGVRIAEA